MLAGRTQIVHTLVTVIFVASIILAAECDGTVETSNDFSFGLGSKSSQWRLLALPRDSLRQKLMEQLTPTWRRY